MEYKFDVLYPLLTVLRHKRGVKNWSVITVLALAGCDTPSPAFKGVPAQRVTIGQSTFDVRIKESRAEALRLNSEWAPRLKAVAPRATIAIEKVSGCAVKRLYGDQAMVRADLACNGRPAPAPQQPVPLACEEAAPARAQAGMLVYEIRCREFEKPRL